MRDPDPAFIIPFSVLPESKFIRGPRYKVQLGGRRFTINISMRIAVKDLLETLKANRDRHAELYAEAVAGYCTKAIANLQGKIQTLTASKPIDLYIGDMRPPTNHTADYDRVIAMLSKTTDEDITLDEGQYAQLVDDDWDWARDWINRNSDYSVKTSSYGISKGWRR